MAPNERSVAGIKIPNAFSSESVNLSKLLFISRLTCSITIALFIYQSSLLTGANLFTFVNKQKKREVNAGF